ncbi:hypothetical protein ACWC3X_40715 [Streptomyces populi]
MTRGARSTGPAALPVAERAGPPGISAPRALRGGTLLRRLEDGANWWADIEQDLPAVHGPALDAHEEYVPLPLSRPQPDRGTRRGHRLDADAPVSGGAGLPRSPER